MSALMGYLDIARQQLPVDEGVEQKLYQDTMGKWSIGIGRNLSDDGVSEDEIALMFSNDLKKAEDRARQIIPNFDALSDGRKAAVMNLTFQMGFDFRAFTRTIACILCGDWQGAHDNLLKSDYAREVPARAERVANALLTG